MCFCLFEKRKNFIRLVIKALRYKMRNTLKLMHNCFSASLCVLSLLCAWSGHSQTTNSNWQQLSDVRISAPSPRYYASMTYNPITQIIYLFGGAGGSGTFLNDTWTFNGTLWSQQSIPGPSLRSGAPMAYMPTSSGAGQSILFGGTDQSGNIFNDTWIFNNSDWIPLELKLSPPARYGAGLSYDSHSQSVVLFGGSNGAEYLGDTWLFDGTSWSPLSSTSVSPPPRAFASMASNIDGHIILFGGQGSNGRPLSNGQPLNDTWKFEGTSWVEKTPPTSPPARYNALFAYDLTSLQFVLYGGESSSTNSLIDTWAFNGTTWNKLNPVNIPLVYAQASLSSFNSSQLILFGGLVKNPGQGEVLSNITYGFEMNFSPRFTSANTVSFPVNVFSSFNITTESNPVANISTISALPDGVTFDSSTGILQGIPSIGTLGQYTLNLTASNGVDPQATQTLSLIVTNVNTSLQASASVLNYSKPLTLTALPPGSSTSGTVTFYDVESSDTAKSFSSMIPLATVTLENGQAIFTTSQLSTGTHRLYATHNETFSTSDPIIVTVQAAKAPSHVKGVQKINQFLTQTDVVNILLWTPPKNSSPIVKYEIYGDVNLTKLLGTVHHSPWKFLDHDQKKGALKIYYIISVDDMGNKSDPVSVKIKK